MKKSRLRSVTAATTLGIVAVSTPFVAPQAQALGAVCDFPDTPLIIERCNWPDVTKITYTVVDRDGNPVTTVYPGQEYKVTIKKWVNPRATHAKRDFTNVETKYEMIKDNDVRIDFVGKKGSIVKKTRVNTNGELEYDGDIYSVAGQPSQEDEKNIVETKAEHGFNSQAGELYIPRDARSAEGDYGVQAPQIIAHFADGTSRKEIVPMHVEPSLASKHEIAVRDERGAEGTDYSSINDQDRSVVGHIDIMAGDSKTFSIRNIDHGDEPVTEEEKKFLEKYPAHMFVTNEYSQVLDAKGEDVDDPDYKGDNAGVGWAALEEYQDEGHTRHELQLVPGAEQLGENGEARLNYVDITTQYVQPLKDDAGHIVKDDNGNIPTTRVEKTSRIEVMVRPSEELEDLPKLPATTVEAWSVKEVGLEGDPPTKHGALHYSTSEKNPWWMTVNPYSGQVTYKPQKASVAYKSYPVKIEVVADSGAKGLIESTVTITPNKQTLKNQQEFKSLNSSSHGSDSTLTGPPPKKTAHHKGVFAKFWDALFG